MYVIGENDGFWHYCKNCSKYPLEITNTIITKPKKDLCSECFENEQNDTCEGKTVVIPPLGSCFR
jgi:hypothetical protein